jgi:hypothetical protein
MRRIITLDEVNDVRGRIARAHALAADRFRAAFESSDAPAEERWRTHLGIQAAALLEVAGGTRIRGGGAIEYEIRGRDVTPFVVRGEPLFPHLSVVRTDVAVFEYFLIVSELLASPAWSVTKLIASAEDFDAALRRMQQPQIVRATFVSFLPAVDLRDDDTALLEVTLHTRAGEERIERRHLVLDDRNEFHFHSRDLVAEGRGGVNV